jgi:hypothetical protein
MTLGHWRAKWSVQRSDAKRRGILFLLTFDEWFGIWKESGKLAQRGNVTGRYVMARFGDRGPYAVGNVRIILFEENAREYRPTLEAKTRTGLAHRGKVVSAETRGKLALKARARATPEYCAALSAAKRGKPNPAIAESNRRRKGEKRPSRTPEHREKLAAAARSRSIEVLVKMSASAKRRDALRRREHDGRYAPDFGGQP